MRFICYLHGAFNALLKTLEEPPAHVKFILATTEPQKLPATILSRCQIFDFKKIPTEDIIKKLEYICKQSNIKIEKQALNMIAVLSEGALRDGISILERCIQETNDKIDEDMVRELVGLPKLEYISKTTEAILNQNQQEAMLNINEVIKSGKDIDNFLWEIIKYIKDILLYKTNCKLDIYTKEEINKIELLSKILNKEDLLKLIYILSELANDIKWSAQKTIMFEAGIIRACMILDIKKNIKIEIEDEDIKLADKKELVVNRTNPEVIIKTYNDDKDKQKEILKEEPIDTKEKQIIDEISKTNRERR